MHNQIFVSERYLVVFQAQVVGRIQTKTVTCLIVCPQAKVGTLVFISNGRAINWRRFIKDLLNHFGYEYEQQDAQYLSLLTCNGQWMFEK